MYSRADVEQRGARRRDDLDHVQHELRFDAARVFLAPEIRQRVEQSMDAVEHTLSLLCRTGSSRSRSRIAWRLVLQQGCRSSLRHGDAQRGRAARVRIATPSAGPRPYGEERLLALCGRAAADCELGLADDEIRVDLPGAAVVATVNGPLNARHDVHVEQRRSADGPDAVEGDGEPRLVSGLHGDDVTSQPGAGSATMRPSSERIGSARVAVNVVPTCAVSLESASLVVTTNAVLLETTGHRRRCRGCR